MTTLAKLNSAIEQFAPTPVATSYSLRNALTIEKVVEIINAGNNDACELTSSELAGQYAEQAAFESGYAVDRSAIDAHLDFLSEQNANFDYREAVAYGLKINAARDAA